MEFSQLLRVFNLRPNKTPFHDLEHVQFPVLHIGLSAFPRLSTRVKNLFPCVITARVINTVAIFLARS